MMNYIICMWQTIFISFGFTADMLRSSEASNKVVASASYQTEFLSQITEWLTF